VKRAGFKRRLRQMSRSVPYVVIAGKYKVIGPFKIKICKSENRTSCTFSV
jgi:hypothetical protein